MNNTSFDLVVVIPDTPDWESERRFSIGASEVASVLNLSKWGTPLSVYLSKKGAPSNFDQELSYVTHASEDVVDGWVRKFHPEWGTVEPGFMARSKQFPWLHASFDRILVTPEGKKIPLQIKTGHQNAKAGWDNGVPMEYQIQEQAEMLVYGADTARLVVMHGGRSFDWFDIKRDDQFINEHLVPKTKAFWEDNVLADVAPEPVTSDEAVIVWPGNEDISIEGGQDLFELWGAYGSMQAEAVELAEQIDAIKLQLQLAMKDATELTYQGQTLFTWKPRKGATRFDTTKFKQEHPEMVPSYMSQGPATRTFIRKTVKEVQA